jgi:hypothetical protein
VTREAAAARRPVPLTIRIFAPTLANRLFLPAHPHLKSEGLMAEQTTPVQIQRSKTLLKTERRAWLRFPSDQEARCQSVTRRPHGEPELAWLGNVRDVSFAGIGLSMSRRFEPGAELIVELSDKPEPLLLPVRVIHATPDKNGRWFIGCEFVVPLSQKALRICLRQKSADE